MVHIAFKLTQLRYFKIVSKIFPLFAARMLMIKIQRGYNKFFGNQYVGVDERFWYALSKIKNYTIYVGYRKQLDVF